jgi:hypothetical protein
MKQTLTLEQTNTLLTAIKLSGTKAKSDYALVMALLFCGRKARAWTWGTALRNVCDLPAEVYNALRELATARHLDITLSHSDYQRHWASGLWERAIFCAADLNTPYTTAEVSRRIKRHAKRARLEMSINLRTILNTHASLQKQFGKVELSAPFILEGRVSTAKRLPAAAGTQRSRDPRLHGINRRTSVHAS